MGASAVGDGLSTTAFPTNSGAGSVEAFESIAPLLVWKKEFRQDSGGAGQHRGGLGQEIEGGDIDGAAAPLAPVRSPEACAPRPVRGQGRDDGGDLPARRNPAPSKITQQHQARRPPDHALRGRRRLRRSPTTRSRVGARGRPDGLRVGRGGPARLRRRRLVTRKRIRVGIDVGGTFTDFVLVDELRDLIYTGKRLTTSHDPSEAIFAGLARLLREAGTDPDQLHSLVHGTTLVANTIIERTGARVGYVTTRG